MARSWVGSNGIQPCDGAQNSIQAWLCEASWLLALDVQVAAHVAAGDLAEPQQAEHQVGEVLADPGAGS